MSSTVSQTHTMVMEATKPDTKPELIPEDEAITADNLDKIFPGTLEYLAKPEKNEVSTQDKDLKGTDPKQAEYMKEVCIILDENDKPIGGGSKKICHSTKNIERGLLHRAFSVFLFDSQNRLLLQQRARKKITFPNMWTNTCCSHPLNMPEEAGVDLEEAKLGAKRAAVRKLWDELRIEVAEEDQDAFLEKFHFLTRIQYKAKNISPDDPEKVWSEHEIDYILFIKADLDHTANPDEVKDTRYVTPEELKEMRKDKSLLFTPWFSLLCENVLFSWWAQLDEIDQGRFESEKDIRRW